MYLIRVGRRTLNLCYLVMSEEGAQGETVPPGVVRITMESGKEFDLKGTDADAYLRAESEAITRSSPLAAGAFSPIMRVNPQTGDVSPGTVDPCEQSG